MTSREPWMRRNTPCTTSLRNYSAKSTTFSKQSSFLMVSSHLQAHPLNPHQAQTPGLGAIIRSFLTTRWSKGQTTFPQPHFGFITSFRARVHRLKALVAIPAHITRLGTTLEAVAAAIRVIQTSFQDVRKKAVKSNLKRSHIAEELDSDAVFNRVDCASPTTKEEARDLAEELSRRLCNMMEVSGSASSLC